MAYQTVHAQHSRVWRLVRKQHGVITRDQLLRLGFSHQSILHRLKKGRLHPVMRGVYVVGRPELTREGQWMAAVLSCGHRAALSHGSAAALWGIGREGRGLEISVPFSTYPRRPEIRVHRRRKFNAADVTYSLDIPVTTPICTLVDLATRLRGRRLERAIGEADKLNLVDPESLRKAVGDIRRPGAAILRNTLDQRTFVLTHSELERMFLPIARRAGLDRPLAQQIVNGLRVDYFWPALKLVVEVDGLRYHRTAAQQSRDRKRDQILQEVGITPLRFTFAQVAFEQDETERTLVNVSRNQARKA